MMKISSQKELHVTFMDMEFQKDKEALFCFYFNILLHGYTEHVYITQHVVQLYIIIGKFALNCR